MNYLTLNAFGRLVKPLVTRVANLVSRGVVKRVDDSKQVQELQVELLEGEVRDELERLQPYGFSSVPDAGAECVVVFVGGRRDHGFALAVDDRRYRPKDLPDGTVCVYGKSGSLVKLLPNGDIELTPSSGKLVVNGTLEATGDVKAGAISLQNHTHGGGTYVANTTGTAAAQSGPVSGSSGGPS